LPKRGVMKNLIVQYLGLGKKKSLYISILKKQIYEISIIDFCSFHLINWL